MNKRGEFGVPTASSSPQAGKVLGEGKLSTRGVISFGLFQLDPTAGELRRRGERIKIQDKPMLLLLLLIRQAGATVTRDELRTGLWPDGTFVDFDANLKTALNKLRYTLGDSAESPVFIETIPRRGYRFIAPVTIADGEPSFVNHSRYPGMRSWPLAAALVACVVAGVLTLSLLRRPPVAQPSSRKVVLLVLPFDNLSGSSAQEYFSDGLTDEMITLLGRQNPGSLAVIARNSAMRYKGTHASLREISDELGGVQFVLEGSVRRSGNHVGINVQLLQAQDQQSVWTNSYESEVSDILALQRDIADKITVSVLPQIFQDAQVTRAATADAVAYDDFLKGLYEANHRTEVGLRKSLEYFERSVRRDPSFAPAFVGLANSYVVSAGWSMMSPAESYPRAREAALRALQIDPASAEAHAVLAEVEHEYKWKWQDAEREFRKALELDPNSAFVHKSYAEFLMHARRNPEALAQIEIARQIDPLSLIINSLVGFAYFNSGQYQRAEEECRRVVQLDEGFAPGHYFLGAALLRQQRFTEAVIQLQTANHLTRGSSLTGAALAHAYMLAGRTPAAMALLSKLQQSSRRTYVSPYGLARVYADLGENDRALELLERAADEHAFEMVFLAADQSFATVRHEPRFIRLLARIGFPAV